MKLAFNIANKRQKIRFGAVGIINTAVDFGIYTILSYVFGWPLLLANFLSTSAGFIVSFFLNRKFTFDSKNDRKLHEFGRFLATTLVGLWIIQPAVIYYFHTLFTLFHWSNILTIVAPKFIAILFGLIWNYLWYSRFVFATKRPDFRHYLHIVRTYVNTALRSDFAIPLAIALVWQACMTIIGVAIQYMFTPAFINPAHTFSIAATSPLVHTVVWDGDWFRSIAGDFYRHSIAAPAFYPLFPVSVRVVQFIFLNRLDILLSALLLNTVCLWLGLTALWKIARIFFGDTMYKGWTLMCFLAFPSAFFLHLFYSEAIFIAFGFWAYYFALRRNWLASSLCLLFLSASRVTAVLFIGLAVLEFWRSHNWSIKKTVLNPRILWFALAPLGFVVYAIYLKLVRGDFLAMFHAYKYGWSYQKFNPNIWPLIHQALHVTKHCAAAHFMTCSVSGDFVNVIMPFIGLCIALVLSLIAIFYLRGPYIPLGVMGILADVMFMLNSNLVSIHRYLLPILTLYLVVVRCMQKWKLPLWVLFPVIQLCFTLQILLFFLYINLYFAG